MTTERGALDEDLAGLSSGMAALVATVQAYRYQEQDTSEVLERLLKAHDALRQGLEGMLDLWDRTVAREPSWAQDRDTLAQARAALASVSPTTREDPARAEPPSPDDA